MTITARRTERVTRVFLLADQEAARAGDARVRTVHLLLGLAREDRDGVLGALDLDDVRAEATIRFRRRERVERRPSTPGVVAALDTAIRLAEDAGDPTVGARHLLVAVLADDAEDAAQVLHDLGADVDGLRAEAGRRLVTLEA